MRKIRPYSSALVIQTVTKLLLYQFWVQLTDEVSEHLRVPEKLFTINFQLLAFSWDEFELLDSFYNLIWILIISWLPHRTLSIKHISMHSVTTKNLMVVTSKVLYYLKISYNIAKGVIMILLKLKGT